LNDVQKGLIDSHLGRVKYGQENKVK
jgi:hypothetical protein